MKKLNTRAPRSVFLALTIFFLLSASNLTLTNSPDYTLDWWTVDGGGYSFSQGNGYSLGGTIGQPDAGELHGGSYILQGGFWPDRVVDNAIYLPLVLR